MPINFSPEMKQIFLKVQFTNIDLRRKKKKKGTSLYLAKLNVIKILSKKKTPGLDDSG